jgi:DNA-directed RNA polymerase subunit RPC12/RpoP
VPPGTSTPARFRPWGVALRVFTMIFCLGFAFWSFFCCWPLGAILAVFLALTGVFGLFMPGGFYEGPCPYCAPEIRVDSTRKGVTCPACKRRAVVKAERFFRVD